MMFSKEYLLHLFKNVLELEEDNRKYIVKLGYQMYRKFSNMCPSDNEKLLKDEKITMACSQEIRYIFMYIDETALSELVVMAIRPETWRDVDIKMLKADVFLALTPKKQIVSGSSCTL